jgi:hypothetical protein
VVARMLRLRVRAASAAPAAPPPLEQLRLADSENFQLGALWSLPWPTEIVLPQEPGPTPPAAPTCDGVAGKARRTPAAVPQQQSAAGAVPAMNPRTAAAALGVNARGLAEKRLGTRQATSLRRKRLHWAAQSLSHKVAWGLRTAPFGCLCTHLANRAGWSTSGVRALRAPRWRRCRATSRKHALTHLRRPCFSRELAPSAGETNLFDYLNEVLKHRIMMIDGAMGTMIQVRAGAWPLTRGAATYYTRRERSQGRMSARYRSAAAV